VRKTCKSKVFESESDLQYFNHESLRVVNFDSDEKSDRNGVI
jgi:hypothetical protein